MEPNIKKRKRVNKKPATKHDDIPINDRPTRTISEINENFIFYLDSQDGPILKQYFDSLRHMLKKDVNFVFTESGIDVTYADMDKHVIIISKLHSKEFAQYKCIGRIPAGIDVSKLYRIVKSIQSNEVLLMHIDRNKPGNLIITIRNNVNNCKTVYTYDLIEEVEDEEYSLPDFAFPCAMRISSQSFQKKIHDMDMYGVQFVEMQSLGEQLILRNINKKAPMEVVFTGRLRVMSKNSDGAYIDTTNELQLGANERIFQGVFNLKTICELVKKPGMCDDMTFYLRNDLPLLIEYSVSNIGYLRMFILPEKIVED